MGIRVVWTQNFYFIILIRKSGVHLLLNLFYEKYVLKIFTKLSAGNAKIAGFLKSYEQRMHSKLQRYTIIYNLSM